LGGAHAIEHDWRALPNEYRRRSCGGCSARSIDFTIDNVHRDVLDDLLTEHGHHGVCRRGTARQSQNGWHQVAAWPDFVPALDSATAGVCLVSFTILTLSLVIDVLAAQPAFAWECRLSLRDAAHL